MLKNVNKQHIALVSIQDKNSSNSISEMKNNIPRKFLVAEIKFEDNSKIKILRIAKNSNDDTFHRNIFNAMFSEFKKINALVIPLYGGKILRDDTNNLICVGGSSISFPTNPNWAEVFRIISNDLPESYSNYQIKYLDII